MASSRPATMRAVIFKDVGQVTVEDRPTPKIEHPRDAVLKVTSTALCGSDLHFYRGHLKIPTGFISGHEFVGIIDELGEEVTNFKVGEEVVIPFFTACGSCFFCKRGEASRCPNGKLFGNSQGTISIDGGQAEYVRVPLADTTMVLAPKTIPRELLVLMADIFPTGYFGARRFLSGLRPDEAKQTVSVVIGCGPVGICAIASAKYLTRGAKVFAIDSVPERLAEAEKLGAIALKLDPESNAQAVKDATEGRGADVVMEIVGHTDALQLAFALVRPFGKISSIGVHTATIPMEGFHLYGKNVTMAFGRCPVRSIFEEALAVLEDVQDQVKFLCGTTMKLEEAPEAYKIFEQRKVHKVIFDMS